MKRNCCVQWAAMGLLVAVTPSSQLPAQTAPTPPTFEVASVKPSIMPSGVQGGCHGIDSRYTPAEEPSAPPLGRCVITSGRLSHLINIAFGMGHMMPIKGGPDWVSGGDERFNVEAKAENPTKTTEQQLLQMLQGLLLDRFSLKFHRETVEKQGFALLPGKNGPKLTPTQSKDASISFGPGVFKPMPGQPVHLTARKWTIAELAQFLGFAAQGPVVDQTGLTGEYDISLSWDENAGPALSTALRDQLGLRLESQKVPVSLFVIDSAQRPSGN